jgi:molybdopterin synthase catalytic subunit
MVTDTPLALEDLAREVAEVSSGRGEGCGAVATFSGLVRAHHKGRAVTHLVYEAYAPLAVRTFEQIAREVAEDWPGVALGIHHRTGRLGIGAVSVIVAAADAHRAGASEACRYAIERVKQIAPVWKHEFFAGGDAWVEGALADPEDTSARAAARARACASA